MKKHQRLRQKRFNERIARTGLVKRTRFYIGVDMAGGKDMSYVVHGYWYPGNDAFHVSGFEVRP